MNDKITITYSSNKIAYLIKLSTKLVKLSSSKKAKFDKPHPTLQMKYLHRIKSNHEERIKKERKEKGKGEGKEREILLVKKCLQQTRSSFVSTQFFTR